MTAEELAEKKHFTIIHPIIKEAKKHNISVSIVSKKNNIFKFSTSNKHFFAVGDIMPFCRKYKPTFTKNKEATKEILAECGISTPKGIRARSFESALKKIQKNDLTPPLILKPLDGLRAYGVTWNINSNDELRDAISAFEKIWNEKKSIKSKSFLVEEQFDGEEYRVLTLKDKVIACAKKIPPTVTGDGESTIEQLIDQYNKTRDDGFKVSIDDVVKKELKSNKLELNTIPQKNEKIRLRNDIIMASGGRAIDCTQKVSPKLQDLCVTAANTVGLEYAGIDILIQSNSEDLLVPKKYKILEINLAPGHYLNEAPLVENPTVNVSKTLLEHFLGKI
jgi:cyanophycin synthetase